MVIIVRTLEHDRPRLEPILGPRRREIALAERRRDHRRLHDPEIEQIALQHQEACPLHHRRVERLDHLAVAGLAPRDVLTDRPARDGQARRVELSACDQFVQHRRHAARPVEALAEILPRRLHVHQQRQVIAMIRPVLRIQRHARVLRHRHDVRLSVARPTDRADHADRVQKALTRENFRRPQILIRHLDDPAPGFVRHLPALAVRRWNCSAACQ